MSEVVSVSEMFGKDVFNDAVMKDRLPKSVYKKLKKYCRRCGTCHEGLGH